MKNIWVFLFQKYSKFQNVLLNIFTKHKALIFEQWDVSFCTFVNGPRFFSFLWQLLTPYYYTFYMHDVFYFHTRKFWRKIFLYKNDLAEFFMWVDKKNITRGKYIKKYVPVHNNADIFSMPLLLVHVRIHELEEKNINQILYSIWYWLFFTWKYK